jgi:hypothetical protein
VPASGTSRRDGKARAPDGVRPFRASFGLAAASCATRRKVPTWFVAIAALTAVTSLARICADYAWMESIRTGSESEVLRVLNAVSTPLLLGIVLLWIFERRIRRFLALRRQQARGGARWWLDADWPAAAAERRIARGVRTTLSTPLAVALALLAFWCAMGHMVTWGCASSGRFATAMELALEAPSVVLQGAALVWLIVVLLPRTGRGRLIVAWPSFPQRTGGTCSFHVGTTDGGARIDGVRVFLRAIAEARWPQNPLVRRPRLLWVAEATGLGIGAHVSPDHHLRAAFAVPADLAETCLVEKATVHWEVLVVGTVGGAEYADRVTVPVYAPDDRRDEAAEARKRVLSRVAADAPGNPPRPERRRRPV